MRNRAGSVDHRKTQERGHTLYHRPPARLSPTAQFALPNVPPQNTSVSSSEGSPTFLGIPVKYIALVTLAVQNAALSIIMHYSRIVTSPKQAYSAATAVLMNELTKGIISFAIALTRIEDPAAERLARGHGQAKAQPTALKFSLQQLISRIRSVTREVFSTDCWKLSIPAILYVIQNNLQFVAAANLDVVIFQVSYQMKILTTAACSVLMLKKRLTPAKWFSLFLLALGVAIVQIQTATPHNPTPHHGTQGATSDSSHHTMHHLKGLTAVILACFTSGLAGVYFEMVLKGSKADLWIRNVQLSLFSLIPALAPILFGPLSVWQMFDGFGFWAWSTVVTQVAGGLITALVIKFSDNIIKGFATSISIVLSFLASIILFNFRITPAFIIGAITVMAATWMYNQPQQTPDNDIYSRSGKRSFPGSPRYPSSPILGQVPDNKRGALADLSPRTVTISPKAVAAALGISSSSDDLTAHRYNNSQSGFYNNALAAHSIHSNVSSRAPSPPLPREPGVPEHISADLSALK